MISELAQACAQHPAHTVSVGGVLYFADGLLEYWLGKTKVVRANSKVELLENSVAVVAALLQRKKKDAENSSASIR